MKAGKHVILVGAPGVGKTDLVIRILEIIGKKVIGTDSYLGSVASDEWSRYELIGGVNLDNIIYNISRGLGYKSGQYYQMAVN